MNAFDEFRESQQDDYNSHEFVAIIGSMLAEMTLLTATSQEEAFYVWVECFEDADAAFGKE